MTALRRSNPHLRLTAAILVAMVAALTGALAADSADGRTRRGELQTALRLVVVSDEAQTGLGSAGALRLLAAVDLHDARAALIASDSSSVRAERSLRRVAAHARAATLQTTALPPPLA
jgi:hypothetical protein